MTKKIYNKLIRDKIPEIIRKTGKNCTSHIADDAEFEKALVIKLKEEFSELLEARAREDIINEAADVMEILEAFLIHKGIEIETLTKKKEIKKEERGGFEKRIILEEVSGTE